MARSNKEVSLQIEALGLEPPNGSLLRRFPHLLQPPLRLGGAGCPAPRAPRRDEDMAESLSSPCAALTSPESPATAKHPEKTLE
mmetsp:Transcript_78536/g.123913  ORF Transcript_78536/g.123913 Transcript_78536/m.123913 type:complete len:84 (-) Transcript_78536:206-457(-)